MPSLSRGHLLENWWRDLRYASRSLSGARGLAAAAVAMLALGVAGTTVMFTMIEGVLLRPLPVRDQSRLVIAWKEARSSESARYPFGNTEIEAVARDSRLLVSAAGVDRNAVGRTVLTDGSTTGYANEGLVTGGFFDVLDVHPVLGRTLSALDDGEGAEPVIVISSGLWRRQFGGRRDVIGRRVVLGESPFTVVGVMPPDLDYPAGVEIWRPTTSVPTTGPFGDAARREVNLIARLREGVTVAQARSEIVALDASLAPATAVDGRSRLVPVVRPFADVVIGDVRAPLLALFAAVGLVLVVACANVANLLLLRTDERSVELALRASLGAGPGRILQLVFAEAVVLAVPAGALGISLAWAGLRALVAVAPDGLPRAESIHVDHTVGLFAVAVVFVAAALAGIPPALHALRCDVVPRLRQGPRTTAGRSVQRWLVVGQVALAVLVLAAAGVLIRSVLKLQAVDLGVAADRLVLFDLLVPGAQLADRQRHGQFLDEAVVQLQGLPDIAAVTPLNVPPFTGQGWDVPRFTAEGQDAEQAAANPTLNVESVHPGYFATLEIPIIRGRAFTDVDRAGAAAVAIVSADVAARVWPDEDPIGRRLKIGGTGSDSPWCTVIGVAGETRYRTVRGVLPTLYLPAAQFQMTATLLAVRTAAPLERLTSVVTDRLAARAPDVRVMQVRPFAEMLARPLARPRFQALVLAVFAGVALLLSAVGLYAVMAASVRRRDREIAIRLALGATTASIRSAVVVEAGRLTVAGVLAGVVGAMIATRALRSMVFEVEPSDPASLLMAGVVLVCAAALAAVIPLRRATRVDILALLRQ